MSNNCSLGILIPTRNRAKYLNTLLELMMPQTIDLNINVYVRDNNSSDNTALIIQKYQGSYSNLFYEKNVINVGADVNFLLLIHNCKEDYFWIFGDDEIILPNALAYIMNQFIIFPDYIIIEEIAKVYNDFRSYVNVQFTLNPWNLISCTLITSNIIKKEIFDFDFASSKLTTHYGHMYGIVKPLSYHSTKIVTIKNNIFKVRAERATPIDGDWPKNLADEWIAYLKFLAISNNLEYPWLKIEKKKILTKVKSLVIIFLSFFLTRRIKNTIKTYLLRLNNK